MSERLTLGIAGHFAAPAEAVYHRSRRIEEAGWASEWWPDAQIGYHPASPTVPAPHEVYDWAPMIGAACGATRRVALGVSVTDPFRRHPALLAQTSQTLHDLSKGRFVLGLGLGAIENHQPFGIAGSSSVAILEEALDIMRLLWSTTEPVSFEGRRWRLDDAVLGLDSGSYGSPPVWIGGTGPRTLDLAGRKADGWIPVMPSVEDYASHLTAVRSAASASGRDPEDVAPACLFLTVASENSASLDRLLDTPWVRAVAMSQPASQFERLGIEHPLGPARSGMRNFVPTHWSLTDYLDLAGRIPLPAVKQLVLWGDGERLAERLSAFRDAGLRHGILWNITGLGEATRDDILGSFRALDQAKALLS
jgi:phthiodiolone/phenolphthiodiolone dimycocerosates ketoreductase